jgi:hypothetical protein
METKDLELKITFPSKEIKDSFAGWLCRLGEQQYMESMAVLSDVQLRFSYHGVEDEKYPHNNKRRYGEFLCDNIVRVSEVN